MSSAAAAGEADAEEPGDGLPDPEPPERREMARQQAPPLEYDANAPAYYIPEWEPLGREHLSPAEASRHVLITGETGSGKTKSAILPFARAALRYPESQGPNADVLSPSMLVIDPKREIAPDLEETRAALGLERSITRLARSGRRLWFFEASDPLDLTPGEVVERIFSVSDAYQREKISTPNGSSVFFYSQSKFAAGQLIGVDLELYRRGGTRWLTRFWTEVSTGLTEAGLISEPLDIGKQNYIGLHSTLFNLAAQARGGTGGTDPLDLYLERCQRFGVPEANTRTIASIDALPKDTFTSLIGTLNNFYRTVASREFAEYVWLSPFEAPPRDKVLNRSGFAGELFL